MARIGYVVLIYPRLSETFVLNEILALEHAGFDLSIFSIYPTDDPRFHAEISRVRANVHYLPQPWSAGLLESMRMLRRFSAARFNRGLDRAFEFASRLPPEYGGTRLGQALKLASLATDLGLDHLHAHFMLGSAQVAYLAHLITGIPFTVTTHAIDVYHDSVDPLIFGEIARAAMAMVTVCDANRSYISERFLDGDESRIVRIYNGLPLDEMTYGRDAPRDRQLIFGAGRLVDKKGWNVLLEACRILGDRGREFKCVIAGGGPNADLLVDERRRLGLEDRVSFVGSLGREEVLGWMAAARVLAAPCVTAPNGDQDALPTVLLEALALGLPVVSTLVGGIPEIVEDGVEGLLVPERDSLKLADALDRLLTQDDLWWQMSAAGPRKVASTFDQKKTLLQLVEVFQRAAREPAPR
ncbi:MAG TPA: glycosyltransferase [Gemmatimonadales bacterium]|nr:glycosyltransferase [Gemmatimonadales bacterium]